MLRLKENEVVVDNLYNVLLLMMIFMVIWLIGRGIRFTWRKEFSFKREIRTAAIPFGLMFIYLATLFPFPFYNPYEFVGPGVERQYNVIPFKSMFESLDHFYYMVPLRNIGGNILLFMPFGFALLYRFPAFTFWRALIIGFLVSLIIELSQLKIGFRSFDVDDLILNTFGTLIGMILYKGATKNDEKGNFPAHES
ncbi:VanZ family protein [Fictibacillus phosphorivorans]|uniref:VanZ family protein n=1 Tax=Fictibacillus phosphorivorans TaxID=1221500 RepID=UPI0020400F06|nr:VanZ family protein [Fictibacillus phosphorivorans]MCM3719054.1 VanZ family protein [Fictibacillus phosphorivorans]MCM3776676.1 VanZ family protein [Fictibacillus phosphorivorans]